MVRALVLGFLLAGLGCVSVRAEPIQGLIDPGKLTWGTSPTFTPFEYVENGKPAGFDVDLADAIAAKMGLQSQVMPIEFKGLIPALLGGRIDEIYSGMYINADRQQVADLIPYLLVGDQLVVAKGNPLHVAARLDLCGHRVAAPVATVFETSAHEVAADCKSAGKPDVTLVILPSTAACAAGLGQGRADAIIVSTPTAAALVRETPDGFETAGEPFHNETKVGIAVRKDRPELKAATEAALRAVVADGTYSKLMRKYNLPASSSTF